MSTATDPAAPSPPPATALEVRARLVEALELDLVGPPPGHDLAEERLPGWVRPSTWYLTGFLVPVDAPAEERRDADADDTLAAVPESEGLAEESAGEEDTTAKKGFFPSSLGLSSPRSGRGRRADRHRDVGRLRVRAWRDSWARGRG